MNKNCDTKAILHSALVQVCAYIIIFFFYLQELSQITEKEESSEETIMENSDKEKLSATASEKAKSDFLSRVGAALFYGLSSFMITVVNKHVLTVHKFPSFQV